MTDVNVPHIKPIKHTEYTCKQSKYGDLVPSLPMRGMILAPSFSGKTVLMSNLILDIYRGCFERIYIFSPTVHLDSVWKPVKDYISKEIKVSDKEEVYFEDYDPKDLQAVIEKQRKVTQYLKDNGNTKLYNILIILDDLSENVEFLKSNRLLQALYTKGRHLSISTIISVQQYKSVAPVIRRNLTFLIVFRLRNAAELEALVEEFSNVASKQILYQIYQKATDQKYDFLYINFTTHDINEIFKINFNKKIMIKS